MGKTKIFFRAGQVSLVATYKMQLHAQLQRKITREITASMLGLLAIGVLCH